MTIKARELRRRIQLDGAASTYRHLSEALAENHVSPHEFSIRDLAEELVFNTGGECIGPRWVREQCDPKYQGSLLLEAGDGVDSTAFSNITGQIVYSRILEAYMSEAFVFSRLIPAIATRLSGEKIPGVARIGDKADIVDEGMPYPNFGFGEEFIETPATTKRGFIVPVTREAIFFDRTNLVLRRAGEVGEWLGMNKEKRLIDVAIGAVNNYRRNGSALNTYLTTGDWINDHANELVDWTSVEKAELLQADIVDPNTGEPVIITSSRMVVTPAKYRTALRILNATEVRHGASTDPQTIGANPVASAYPVDRSQLMYQRLQSQLSLSAAQAAEYWFLGDFAKAFAYMENWPITVVQAPQNNEAEFTQDIVARFKCSERGVAAVLDPRYMVRNKNDGS